jgi:hypothetical protein
MDKPESAMSRKAAIAGMAITAISASDNWKTQAWIAGVSIVAIITQAVLDWRKQGRNATAHGGDGRSLP